MKPEEFFKLALESGATIEYADGVLRAEVKPRVEIRVDYMKDEESVPPPALALPRERTEPYKAYPILKEALRPWTSSHIAHIAAALAVMHSSRAGEWGTPGADAILDLVQSVPPKLDMPTLVQCVQRATRFKHAHKVDGQRVTMSTGAFAAAMYDAMEIDSRFNAVDDLEEIIKSKKFIDTVKGIAQKAHTFGGARSIEFRKQSYVTLLQMFTPLK